MCFLAGLERIGHAFDVKQQQQEHTGLSQSTSVNLTYNRNSSGKNPYRPDTSVPLVK